MINLRDKHRVCILVLISFCSLARGKCIKWDILQGNIFDFNLFDARQRDRESDETERFIFVNQFSIQ